MNPTIGADVQKGIVYQCRDFTCRICGITFTVYSDSKIAEQRLCTDCAKK